MNANLSTMRYEIAANKATREGFKAGSHDWWNAIRLHKDNPKMFGQENGCPIGCEDICAHIRSK